MKSFTELSKALNWRYAVRRFSDEIIESEKIEQLLSVIGLSASSYGLQPYKILLIKSKTLRQSLVEHSMGQDKVLNSSHLIVLAAETKSGSELVDRYIQQFSTIRGVPVKDLSGMRKHFQGAIDAMSESERLEWAHQQAYLALGNLLTSAALLNIDACPMGGFDKQGYDRVLRLEQLGLTSTVICAIGYRHSQDSEAFSPKVRFSRDQLVYNF